MVSACETSTVPSQTTADSPAQTATRKRPEVWENSSPASRSPRFLAFRAPPWDADRLTNLHIFNARCYAPCTHLVILCLKLSTCAPESISIRYRRQVNIPAQGEIASSATFRSHHLQNFLKFEAHRLCRKRIKRAGDRRKVVPGHKFVSGFVEDGRAH